MLTFESQTGNSFPNLLLSLMHSTRKRSNFFQPKSSCQLVGVSKSTIDICPPAKIHQSNLTFGQNSPRGNFYRLPQEVQSYSGGVPTSAGAGLRRRPTSSNNHDVQRSCNLYNREHTKILSERGGGCTAPINCFQSLLHSLHCLGAILRAGVNGKKTFFFRALPE